MRTKATNAKHPTERDLEMALCANIKCLEAGLKITGKQQLVEYASKKQESNPGRIDITAKDKRGTTVVIELKVGKVGRRAIGQILGYMGALMRGKRRIRGILVAKKFSPQGRATARCVPALKLRKIRSLSLKSLSS